jgi:hypothetical protein
MGATVRCPKCGNYFTVAPTELVPAKESKRPAASAKRVSTSVPYASPCAVAVALPEPPPPPSESSMPGWINAWGVLAFSLAALAMLLGALALPRWLALCFVGLGLLLGLIGLAMPRDEWKLKDGIWLALGGGCCGTNARQINCAPRWRKKLPCWTRVNCPAALSLGGASIPFALVATRALSSSIRPDALPLLRRLTR